MTNLTADRLRQLVRYDPATGAFIWRTKRRGTAASGSVAGTPHNRGYVAISIDGCRYLAHRLAWLYMTGDWPHEIDHIDMNKSNNRWANLRVATRSQNRANTTISTDNTSGYKGVTWDKDRRKWRAQTMLRGKRLYLGLFDKIENAALAYNFAAYDSFGTFARTI